jgi:hypothetical protein
MHFVTHPHLSPTKGGANVEGLDHLLDEMTEVIDADQMAIEARMKRLQRIVQRSDPPAGWQHTLIPAAAPSAMAAHGLWNC